MGEVTPAHFFDGIMGKSSISKGSDQASKVSLGKVGKEPTKKKKKDAKEKKDTGKKSEGNAPGLSEIDDLFLELTAHKKAQTDLAEEIELNVRRAKAELSRQRKLQEENGDEEGARTYGVIKSVNVSIISPEVI